MSFAESVHFFLSILSAGLIGYIIADLLFPIDAPRWLVAAFALPAGFGICSLIVFFFRRPMFTVEGIVLAVLCLFWLRVRGSLMGWFASGRTMIAWRVPVLAVALFVALGWTASSSAKYIDHNPHGGTDGWAIWDSHAKYMYTSGPAWRQDLQSSYHPDYPLLLPGVIVHAWRFMGIGTPDVAGLVGLLFEYTGIVMLVATLVRLRRITVALLMAFVWIGSPGYVLHALSQYADVPLSIYILATIALICLYEAEKKSRPVGLLVLAGFMAGCAAWTKNEGLPFVLVTVSAMLAPVFWNPSGTRRRIAGFAAGVALPFVAIVYFKMTAPPNDLLSSRNSVELMAKLLNPERYIIILGSFFRTGWIFGGWVFNPFIPILAFVGLCGIDGAVMRNFGWRAGVAIIAMVLASYYAIYVITPLDLLDHLDSSLGRLLMHVWPACLLLTGMAVRNPERSFSE